MAHNTVFKLEHLVFIFVLVATAAARLPMKFPKRYNIPTGPRGKSIVEVLLVLDPNSVSRWEPKALKAGNSVDDEVKVMFNEVKKMFEEFDIELYLKQGEVIYADEDIFSKDKLFGDDDEYSVPFIDSGEAFRTFQKWTQDKGYTYDIALMLVGYDLTLEYNPGAAGLAHVGTACNWEYNAAIVENTYDQRQIIGMAHEIAHLLGASHDGDDVSVGCSDADGYVMTAGIDVLRHANFAKWSKCSKEQINNWLDNNYYKCLTTTSADSKPVQAKHFADVVTADELCARKGGDATHATRLHERRHRRVNNPCQVLTCDDGIVIRDDLTFSSYGLSFQFTPNGQPCGEGMRCNRGDCVPDDTVKLTNGGCYYPQDVTVFVRNPWKNCAEAKRLGYCTRDDLSYVSEVCCNTCNESPAKQKLIVVGK